MNHRVLWILLAIALALASCSPPDPGGYDWCYVYDFTEGAEFVNIIDGEWQDGIGLVTDPDGGLTFNFVHTTTVQPGTIIVYARNGESLGVSTHVQAVGDLFGIPAGIDQVIPPGMDSFPVVLNPSAAGQSGTAINVTLVSTENSGAPEPDPVLFVIPSIEVYGQGQSPFPENPCATFVTPTPSDIPTATLTITPGPSPTPTETLTPSPTITPSHTPNPTCDNSGDLTYDFTVDDHGALTNTTGTIWVSGVGWRKLAGSDAGATGNRVWIPMSVTYGAPNGSIYVKITTSANTSLNFGYMNAGVTRRVDNTGAQTDAWYGPYTATGSGYEDIAVWIQQANTTTSTVLAFRIVNASVCQSEPTPTPTNTPTPSPTPSPSLTRTPIPSWTLGTPTRTPVNPLTRTPRPSSTPMPSTPTVITVTPSSTRTMIAPPTSFLTPTFIPTGDPGGDDPYENEGEWAILDSIGSFFTWIQNTFYNLFDMFGQVINWLVGTARNIGTMISNATAGIIGFINAILTLLSTLFEIGRLLVDLVLRFVTLIGSWMGQLISRLSNLWAAFYNAPAVAIPGLPQCFSNPLAHDICAIYYILDWTFLAPGTPGELIVPILIILMDLWMLFAFARFVLRMVRRGADVTNVG